MTISRSASIAASLILASGLVLTGCSSSSAPADKAPATSEQPAKASGPLTQENFAERISAAQLEAGSAHIAMESPAGAAGTVEGNISISEDPNKMRGTMTMDLPTGSAEIRIVDGSIFMNLGELSGGKFIDLAQAPGGSDIAGSLTQINPESQMKSFQAAIETFSAEPAAEQIDGVDVTKITMVLNTEKLLANSPLGETGSGGQALVDAFGATMEYVMYVGADDLPRRITTPIPGGTYNMDYSAWGEKVTVEAPSADQIADPSVLG